MTITNTPWGKPQQVLEIAPEVHLVSTASHGGIHISDAVKRKFFKDLPEETYKMNLWDSSNWFEEDCEAKVVLYILYPLLSKTEFSFSRRDSFKSLEGSFSEKTVRKIVRLAKEASARIEGYPINKKSEGF